VQRAALQEEVAIRSGRRLRGSSLMAGAAAHRLTLVLAAQGALAGLVLVEVEAVVERPAVAVVTAGRDLLLLRGYEIPPCEGRGCYQRGRTR
jgi:hypothetical protein